MLKKSVIIANRHQTSISIEPEFWTVLQQLAMQKGMSVNQLVTEIDLQRDGENLSSAVRIFILKTLLATVEKLSDCSDN